MIKHTKTLVATLLILLLASALATIWWQWLRQEPLPEGLIQANGRIEGDHHTVASKMAGKIAELKVQEGDAVESGQVLARIENSQLLAKVDQAAAAVDVLKAQLAAARTALATLKQQIPLQVDTAKAGITHRQAALTAANANAEQTAKDAQRLTELLEKNIVDKHRAEQANLAWKVAQANQATATAALTQSKKQLAETTLGWKQVEIRNHEVTALEARLKQGEAALAEANCLLDDLTVCAPTSGIVTTRIVNKGEVVAAGSPQFDIVDLDRLYLKVYIPEKQIGKVRLGLPARIYTDAFPDQAVAATVRYIASRAEFTPKEVQTPDERVKLVYAVKLYLVENPEHRLTPGLPADAIIRWQQETPWAKPRW